MAMNPTRLKPIDLVRLVNTSPLHDVLSDRQLRRHRERAGFRITEDDGATVNLFKYTAWLRTELHIRQTTESQNYEEKKAAVRNRNIALALAGRDIGELPEVENPELKESCRSDFKSFCENYFPANFSLDWSPDHLKVINRIETAVLHGGLFALAMPRGSGKALALDTPLATPDGWTTMGEVSIGDTLFDEQGRQCHVIRKSPVFIGHDCYQVTFNDGESIVCDADHLWQIEDIYWRKNPYVRTTEWLSTHYKIGKRGYHESRFRIPMQKPLQMQTATRLPIAPYVLGVWLGDGTCSASNSTLFDADAAEITHNIKREIGCENFTLCGYGEKEHAVVGKLTLASESCLPKKMSGQSRLRQLGLLDNKHIPREYLRADFSDRLALLQGIMDTDGHVDDGGHMEICIKYSRLAEDFGELLSSLGIKYGTGEKIVLLDGKEHGPYYRFCFNGYKDQEFFQLKRKLNRLRERPCRRFNKKSGCVSHTPCDVRTIVNIEKVSSVPTQCVMVDSPSHLYLAGKRMVPTHNSSLAETAAVWSMLYGHREFVFLVGATEMAALEMLDSIKTELETNERLAAFFPFTSAVSILSRFLKLATFFHGVGESRLTLKSSAESETANATAVIMIVFFMTRSPCLVFIQSSCMSTGNTAVAAKRPFIQSPLFSPAANRHESIIHRLMLFGLTITVNNSVYYTSKKIKRNIKIFLRFFMQSGLLQPKRRPYPETALQTFRTDRLFRDFSCRISPFFQLPSKKNSFEPISKRFGSSC